jgi:hypothetical protein
MLPEMQKSSRKHSLIPLYLLTGNRATLFPPLEVISGNSSLYEETS